MTATDLAERAFLGSLLLDGDLDTGLRTVRTLRPDDFADPWHREVFRAIRDRLIERQPADPHTVGRGLIDRLGPTRGDAVRLTTLMRTAPARPSPSVYAQMVLEAALRREVAGLGVLLRAGALSAVIEGGPRPLHAVLASVDAGIDAAEHRWSCVHEGASRPPQIEPRAIGPGPGPRRIRVSDQALAADRFLSAHPIPTPAQVADHESRLIAALVARPECLGPVRGWLRVHAVTDPAWRSVYAAVIDLADHGRPIDHVTVAWHVQRFGVGPPVRTLVACIDAVTATDPGYLAHTVAAAHLRLRAERAATGLDALAGDLGRDLTAVLSGARTHVVDLGDAAVPLELLARPRVPGANHRPAPSRHLGSAALEGRAG